MKTEAVVLGGLVLAALFAGFFTGVARIEGWRVAAVIWGASIGLTAALVGAIWLVAWGLS